MVFYVGIRVTFSREDTRRHPKWVPSPSSFSGSLESNGMVVDSKLVILLVGFEHPEANPQGWVG
jgi:hypothetical protein